MHVRRDFATCTAIFVAFALYTALVLAVLPSAVGATQCQEDQPCWTWSTMGNRKRSVIDLRSGQRVIVGPCAFRNLWLHGNADLSHKSDRLRGDWTAIHYGCR